MFSFKRLRCTSLKKPPEPEQVFTEWFPEERRIHKRLLRVNMRPPTYCDSDLSPEATDDRPVA